MNCPVRSQGGGVYIYGSSAVVSFTNCDIYDNDGGYHVSLCPAEFHGPHGSSFKEVSLRSQGGGVIVYYATATFTDCEIYSNTAASTVSLHP